MKLEALLETCSQLGIKLELAGENNDRLKVDAPKGALTAELREALTSNKPELIAFLTNKKPNTGTTPKWKLQCHPRLIVDESSSASRYRSESCRS